MPRRLRRVVRGGLLISTALTAVTGVALLIAGAAWLGRPESVGALLMSFLCGLALAGSWLAFRRSL